MPSLHCVLEYFPYRVLLVVFGCMYAAIVVSQNEAEHIAMLPSIYSQAMLQHDSNAQQPFEFQRCVPSRTSQVLLLSVRKTDQEFDICIIQLRCSLIVANSSSHQNGCSSKTSIFYLIPCGSAPSLDMSRCICWSCTCRHTHTSLALALLRMKGEAGCMLRPQYTPSSSVQAKIHRHKPWVM